MGRKAIELDVDKILKDAIDNQMTLNQLAEKYKVSYQTINNRLKSTGALRKRVITHK